MTANKARLSTFVASAALLGAGHAVAQQTDDTAGRADALTIEEVVVTAQKRDENLSDVPVSVQHFSADQLVSSGITSTDDLSALTPGVQMTRVLGNSSPYIRGIGTASPLTGVEPAVATYIDGVYQSAAVANVLAFNNVEAVEILKGPQGTLYGRNATGGLINIITRDPSHDASTHVKLGYGSYDTTDANLYATTGLGASLAADIAAYYHDQKEGYGRNLTLDREFHLEKETALRSKWLLNLGDSTQIRFTADYTDAEGDASNAATAIRRGNDGAFTNVDFYDTTEGFHSYGWMESKGASLQIDHTFGVFDFKSISAYRNVDSLQQFSRLRDPGVPNTAEVRTDNSQEMYSQELQFTSNTQGRLGWVGGLFYMNDTSNYNSPEGFTVVQLTPVGQVKVANTGSEQELVSTAAYIDGNYQFTEATKLSLGVRYTNDDRDFIGMSNPRQTVAVVSGVPTIVDLPAVVLIDDSLSTDEITYRAVLDHRFNDQAMIYGSYATGFKSGGFAGNSPLSVPLRPETVDAIEIGTKLDLADRRVRLSAAAFQYKYEDLQVTKVINNLPLPVNAAEAEIKGAEIEGQALLTEHLSTTFGVAYLDAKYTSFTDAQSFIEMPDSSQNLVGPVIDASGALLRAAPEYTFNLGARYALALGTGELDLSVNYYYNDGFVWAPDERVRQPSYSLVNARLGWTGERFGVGIWGNNLTDEEYYSACRCAENSGDAGTYAAPLTFGVDFTVKL